MLSKMLLKKLTNLPRPVRKLTITLSNLLDDQQMTLPLNSAMHKYLSLSYAVDQINDKYGKNTIMPMRSFDAKHVDLNRVGFAGDLLQESANPTDNNNYK
jgi:hypothetical protein